MKKVEIELKGVKVRAVLYEDKAPVTVATLWHACRTKTA